MNNMILIGMMGCGKSTIGQALAKKLNYGFADMDTMIEEKAHMSIPDMFQISESFFREQERACLEEIQSLDHYVIATGGGVITRDDNCELLSQCGKIIFLERDIDLIWDSCDKESRPLMQKGKASFVSLYEQRKERYENLCDYHMVNDGHVDDLVNDIIRVIKGK